MSIAWCVYLLLILLFFREPERAVSSKQASKVNEATQPLLPTQSGHLPSALLSGLPTCEHSDEEEGEDSSDYGDDRAVETVGELLKELTMPIKILLWIYFMLKFASELLISESSILTEYYFSWTTSQVYKPPHSNSSSHVNEMHISKVSFCANVCRYLYFCRCWD